MVDDQESDEGDETVDATERDRQEGTADTNIYECNECGNRVEAEHQPETCPECGGDMIDISVSRE